jgi:hypothetical protein
MSIDPMIPQQHVRNKAPSATSVRAPSKRQARSGVAAANGGFDPGRIGGEAASWVQGLSALPDMLLANIIVGLYCVFFETGGL